MSASDVLIVNGIQLPTPDGGFRILGTQGVSAGRNALYQVVATPINRRVLKFDNLVWSHLTLAEWRTIRHEIEKFTGVLRFWDALTDSFKYVDIYWGDDEAEPLRCEKGGRVIAYKNCKCNIVDMGWPFKSG